ncbi:unnamed protein product [Dicrocoelium dendriticum]|nr:unnamed protein product [Dicrocoelium dendriticum]
MKRQNVRTLSLLVVTFTYLLLGAAIFDAFESTFEIDEESRLSILAKELRLKYNMSKNDFDHITQLGIQMKPYKAGTQWKFAGAFYFSTTVITTIGYGHSTPKTTWGKIFCMCYAVPGIPLCLVMFQSIGERMNTIITWMLKRMKRFFSCKCHSVSQTNLMVVSFTTGSTVLTIGAAVFSRYEDWTYLDAFYYCFITLTTIGFGDFVALQRNDSLAKRPDYVVFSLIFILFGLTVVSSVMNLLVLRFLTMNTEDERRDQLEAAAQAQELQRLRGDVIWVDQQPVSISDGDHYVEKAATQAPVYYTETDWCKSRSQVSHNMQRLISGISTLFSNSLEAPYFDVYKATNSLAEIPVHGRRSLSELKTKHARQYKCQCTQIQACEHPDELARSLSLPEGTPFDEQGGADYHRHTPGSYIHLPQCIQVNEMQEKWSNVQSLMWQKYPDGHYGNHDDFSNPTCFPDTHGLEENKSNVAPDCFNSELEQPPQRAVLTNNDIRKSVYIHRNEDSDSTNRYFLYDRTTPGISRHSCDDLSTIVPNSVFKPFAIRVDKRFRSPFDEKVIESGGTNVNSNRAGTSEVSSERREANKDQLAHSTYRGSTTTKLSKVTDSLSSSTSEDRLHSSGVEFPPELRIYKRVSL